MMKNHLAVIFKRFNLVALLLALIAGTMYVTPARAASIIVNSSADVASNDGKCTLREAIMAAIFNVRSGSALGECSAGSSVDVDSISFADNYIITLTSQLPYITSAMIIKGNGSGQTFIQAASGPRMAGWRVFQVTRNDNGTVGNLTLDGVTVRNGYCNGACSTVGGINPNSGGAIHNSGILTIKDSLIADNAIGDMVADNEGGGAIYNSGTLSITNSTLSGNSAYSAGGIQNVGGTLTVTNSIFSSNHGDDGGGGGIRNSNGTVTVTDSTFSGNYSGGIHSQSGTLDVMNSVFRQNGGAYVGAGIDVGGGTATVNNSTFSNNQAEFGAISNGGNLTITNSTLSSNTGWGDLAGGGISNSGFLTVANSTFYQNTSNYCCGGGIWNAGSLDATNSTFVQNTAESGGGIFNTNDGEATSILKNTIVANNAGGNCSGAIVNGGHNLDSGGTCGWGTSNGSLSNTDPMLDWSLASNGGPTETVALLSGSPAVNSGNDAFCSHSPVNGVDQRGVSRPLGNHCDIGAYEFDIRIHVTIGGTPKGTYSLGPSRSTSLSYDKLDNGPVKINSHSNELIIASERINLKTYDPLDSYSEVMGLPASKISDTFTFPWYNNTGFLDSQIRFANVGSNNTTVTVKIGGAVMKSYPLAPNQSARDSFAEVDAGPVEIKSSGGVPIIAALRINLKVNSPFTSYSEFLGLSASNTASTRYIFPWYNNTGLLDSQLRFANVGNAQTTVTVKIGGVTQPETYTLDPNQSQRISFFSLSAGPVEVTSSGGVPITAAMRINLKNNMLYTSYTELMGLTGATLTDTRYFFPWYNNTGLLDSQLRFGNVGTATTTVRIKINGVVQPATYTLAPNESVRVPLVGVNNGPVEVYSSNNVPIIASERINLKANTAYDSYYEFMGMSVGSPLGLPGDQLSSTYWFPWYNNTGLLDSQLRLGVP